MELMGTGMDFWTKKSESAYKGLTTMGTFENLNWNNNYTNLWR